MTPKHLLLTLALACCAPVANAQKIDEAGLRSSLGLADYAVSYQGLSGEDLTFDQFVVQLTAGNAFRTTKDQAAKTAVMQITKRDAARPSGSLPTQQAGVSIEVGARIPDVVGKDLAGAALTLPTQGEGYTLLSFYFAQCAPCIKEVPDLIAFRAKHPDVALIAVTFDPAEDALQFKEKWGLDLPTVADAQDYIDQLGVKHYPTLVLTDRNGNLVASKSGGIFKLGSDTGGLEMLEAWFQQATGKE